MLITVPKKVPSDLIQGESTLTPQPYADLSDSTGENVGPATGHPRPHPGPATDPRPASSVHSPWKGQDSEGVFEMGSKAEL